MKNFLLSSRTTTTFLLLVITLVLFNINFDRFDAGAQGSQIYGDGNVGYLAKLVEPQPPTTSGIQVSVNNANYCAAGVHATVNGTYNGVSDGDAFEMFINGGADREENPNTNPDATGVNPNVNPEWRRQHTGIVLVDGDTFSGSAQSCLPSNPDDSPTTLQTDCQMTWNTIYTAWARVRNTASQWSPWIRMGTYCNGGTYQDEANPCVGGTASPPNPWPGGVPYSWITPLHAFPDTDFTFSPLVSQLNRPVVFTDATSFAPTSVGQTWSWNFGGGTPGTATGQGPHTNTYSTAGSYNASLTAGDDIGSCTVLKIVNVQRIIPKWREVPPR